MINFLSPQSICFFMISSFVIISALIAVFTSNIKRALFSLFFTFFGISGFYVLLYSEFLAITQVIIYVGAILILMLFSASLLNLKFLKGESTKKIKIISLLLVLVFFIFVPLQLIMNSVWNSENRVLKKSYDYASDIGKIFLSDGFIILEAVGVLMLLALIGASIMIKKED